MLIMCIPQIILVQVMHDSPDAEDAGILFSFSWKGGAQPFFFMLIMFSLHCSCCRVLRDKHARSCYQTKT